MDLSWLPALVVSVVTLVGGAIYAQRKGLPDLAARADRETSRLVTALEGQLDIAAAELARLKPELSSQARRIEYLEVEVDRLEKRLVRLNLRLIAAEEENKKL
jgi:capsule polysaccharide export protein KpsE/RkpR